MTETRKTFFISDLHLEANQPHITHQFLQFLASCDSSVDALYILGDLFEAWIGDDDESPFNSKIKHALKEKTEQGLPIYFLPGNRDFLIGKKFLRETGRKLLGDEKVINLYGVSVLLMHGDTLCTLDTDYLRSRKKLRNRLLQMLFLFMPLKFRRKIADQMRKESERYTQNTAIEKMDVTQDAVMHVMQKHKVEILIHGHTHKPAFHQVEFRDIKGTRIVLPAWHGNGCVLEWNATGEKKFVDL